jgi:ribonuclease P protein component
LRLRFPKDERLLKPAEFRRVYSDGRRFDGRLITVFALPNNLGVNRMGVTASKKLSTKAHDRNRAKRLIRESFRLSRQLLFESGQNFDWVINARRGLLSKKMPDVLVEFREIANKVFGKSEPQ